MMVLAIMTTVVIAQAVIIAALTRALKIHKKALNRKGKIISSLKSRIKTLEEDTRVVNQTLKLISEQSTREIKELRKCYSRTCDVISGLISSKLLIKKVKYNTSFEKMYEELENVVEFYDINNITPKEVVGLFGKLNPLEDMDKAE